jgi:RNA polymerase sigma-70 factor (ECF subfamily)
LRNHFANIHQELIDRCGKDDSKAQFEIYRLYYKAMYNSSLRIVGTAETAEDIMQEAFLTAFSKLRTYRGEVSFGAWLKKIVINRSLDHLRKRRAIVEELDENLPVTDDEENEPEDITVEDVKAAIASLPEGYRIVLTLILTEGYSHEEASRMLGIRNVTSRTQYSRARQRLKELLITRRNEKLKERIYEQNG